MIAATSYVLGCAHGTAAAPNSTRAVYARLAAAARAHDAAALYALLPDAARRDESFEQFRARTAVDGAELDTLAARTTGALGRTTPRVEVTLANGEVVTTRDAPDGWHLAQAGFGPPQATSPEGAVRVLHAALQRQSLGAVLDALSDRARATLVTELATLAQQTADPEGLQHTPLLPSDTSGLVIFTLSDGRQLVVRQEHGAWRVDDLRDPPP